MKDYIVIKSLKTRQSHQLPKLGSLSTVKDGFPTIGPIKVDHDRTTGLRVNKNS